MQRGVILSLILVLGLALGIGILIKNEPAEANDIVVYKDPYCGCCGGWVKHLEAAGLSVGVRESDDMAGIKADLGIPPRLQSCHTAKIDGYIIEGHVPAADIARLLTQRPQATGLAVPGMPPGSPGMDRVPFTQPYASLLFTEDGRSRTFAKH